MMITDSQMHENPPKKQKSTQKRPNTAKTRKKPKKRVFSKRPKVLIFSKPVPKSPNFSPKNG